MLPLGARYRWNLSDTALILIGLGSRFAMAVLMTLTRSSWMAYLATAIGSLRRIDQFAIQAFVSKQVSRVRELSC